MINGRLSIKRALVSGQFKVPKERSRIRVVELITPALTLLQQLMDDSAGYALEEIEVVQRDNITRRVEHLHFLFRSSTSGLLWSGKTISNWFTARQLGHSDTTMVKKHYGRWIPADTKAWPRWSPK